MYLDGLRLGGVGGRARTGCDHELMNAKEV